ncbi:MAG: hypothetical protein AB7K68_15160 [Bacteriovoracia bacterium]
MSRTKSIPGINIQWPWSRLIVDGSKTVETRRYPIPSHYLEVPLAIIETPGPKGKSEAQILKAQVVGIVCFKRSFRYSTAADWRDDFKRHQVSADSQFRFDSKKETWGWEIMSVTKFAKPYPAPSKRGIVFTKSCKISSGEPSSFLSPEL